LPNWITNRLLAKGNPQRIRSFLDLAQSERRSLDFQRIIPSPEIICHARKVFSSIGPRCQEQYFFDETHWRDFTPQEEKELEALGYRSWEDWSFANSGTNKIAFGVELDETTVGLGYVVIDVETAWSPPIRILERLRDMFPEMAFSCEWFTEDESFHEHHPSQSLIASSETDRADEHIIATLYLRHAECREFFLETQTTKKTGSGYPKRMSIIEPMTTESAHQWMLAPEVTTARTTLPRAAGSSRNFAVVASKVTIGDRPNAAQQTHASNCGWQCPRSRAVSADPFSEKPAADEEVAEHCAAADNRQFFGATRG
jgi:hypothetical protein